MAAGSAARGLGTELAQASNIRLFFGDNIRYPGQIRRTVFIGRELAVLVFTLPVKRRFPESGLSEQLANFRRRPQTRLIGVGDRPTFEVRPRLRHLR